ncbi:hypothetical protein HDU67_004155 [Dinochytrium kinnereticum]|nr:hypothetical protein HDU67_004155 [Dinochytrium kinnereticum]
MSRKVTPEEGLSNPEGGAGPADRVGGKHNCVSNEKDPSDHLPARLWKMILKLFTVAFEFITYVADIPPPPIPKTNDSRDRFRSGLIDPENDISHITGESDVDILNECNPFSTKDGLLANTDQRTLKRYLHIHTLQFRSSRLEELYLRDMILPTRIIYIRCFGLLTFLFFVYYMELVRKRYDRLQFMFFFWGGVVQCGVVLWIIFYKKGKIAVSLYTGSKYGRMLLHLMELYLLLNTVLFDLDFIVDAQITDGSLGTVAVLTLCLTTGLSATFLENTIFLAIVLSLAAVKGYFVATNNTYKSTVYFAPFLVCLILVSDLIFVGDRDRRIRFLKTQIIGSRLKGIQEENRKTEYLLSLTLPWTIVKKLKEVGTGNFDLIAERVENASVMFTDLKNYKEIANSLGSTREAVSLLNAIFQQMDEIRIMYQGLERVKTINSKVLIVGGLTKSDHLFLMIDMALALKNVFESPIMYDLCTEDYSEKKMTPVKLDVAFGIQIGPLVAGIVGKKTFSYEVYGDVVNTASRMLSLASGGQIIITPQVYDLCKDEFDMQYLGERNVKGKGTIKIHAVIGRRDHNADTQSEPGQPEEDRRRSSTIHNSNRRRSTLRSFKDHTLLVKTLKLMSSSIAPPSRRRIDKSILNSALAVAQQQSSSTSHPNAASPSQSVISPPYPTASTDTLLQSNFSGSQDFRFFNANCPRPGSTNLNGVGYASSLFGIGGGHPASMGWRSTTSILSNESKMESCTSDPALEIENIMASGAAVAEIVLQQGGAGGERKGAIGLKRPMHDAPPTVSIPSFALPPGTGFVATNLTQLKEVPSNLILNEENNDAASMLSKANSMVIIEKPGVNFRQNSIEKAGGPRLSIASESSTKSGPAGLGPDAIRRYLPKGGQDFMVAGEGDLDGGSDSVVAGNRDGMAVRMTTFQPHSTVFSTGTTGTGDVPRYNDIIMDITDHDDRTSRYTRQTSIFQDPNADGVDADDAQTRNSGALDSQRIIQHLMKTVEGKGEGDTENHGKKNGAWSWTRKLGAVVGVPEPAPPPPGGNEAIWSTNALMEANKGYQMGQGDDLRMIRSSLTSSMRFSSASLEKRFCRDYNRSTWGTYLGRASRGIACQLIFIGMALFNIQFIDLYEILCDAKRGECPQVDGAVWNAGGHDIPREVVGIANLPWEEKSLVIWLTFIATGSQILLTGLNLFDNQVSPGPFIRSLLVFWSIATLAAVTLLVSLHWSHLFGYRLMTTLVFPQVMVVNALSLDGMDFGMKVVFAFFFMLVIAATNFQTTWTFFDPMSILPEVLAAFLIALTWVFIFGIRETNVRIEYLLDLILITQSDMVRDEMTKSSRVLSTILPRRVTLKLLEDPASMVYEEFLTITVLHMDIAGFTAMSSTMEPLSIFQMLNTLFSHFDRLTEEFNVEKITTIGDAYVASSSLSKEMDMKIAAISVCIVALQMQAFVVHQLNSSPMMIALSQTLSMRIGVHTGPAYGAIMGGEKNFRYDLLGDTVLVAERIQELTPLSAVCMSEVTWELTKDYHGFETAMTEHRVAGGTLGVYGIQGNRGLATLGTGSRQQ